MTGYAYMTASQKRGTIHIGVTNDLGRRMPEPKSGEGSRFTSRYGVRRLVWYEEHFDIRDAIQREKSPKRWPRQWKIDLIEKPEWFELFRRNGVVAFGSGPLHSSADVTHGSQGLRRVASLLASP
ncbi:MAG: GIY-YIG nuclease family protein [Mesorhizobium sp.]|nr:MAG: GIY-YIG nuclease family protein [Mesorhizobium sp.]RWQ32175.1 MAG: GIY-YIG nuclease family protein [Mesorhizobium sp.]